MPQLDAYPVISAPTPNDLVLGWQSESSSVKQITLAVTTIALMQALDVVATTANPTPISNGAYINVLGYYSINDGGGGLFYYNATSSATTNGGTIFSPSIGPGRWIRVYTGWTNVLFFGADPTGVADSTSKIQAAINSLPSGGTGDFPTNAFGGVVYAPTGVYKITSHLTISEGVTLRGDGMFSTIILNVNASGDDSIQIINNGRDSPTPGDEYFTGVCEIQISSNNYSSGCGIKNATAGSLSVNYCVYSNILVNGHGLDGLYVSKAVGGTHTHCYFYNNGRYGVNIASAATSCTAMNFYGCAFRVNGSVSYPGGGVFDASQTSSFIGKNVFESNPYGAGLIADGTYCNYNGCYFENNNYLNEPTNTLQDQISVMGYGNVFTDCFLNSGRVHIQGTGSNNQFWSTYLPNNNPNFIIDNGCNVNQILFSNPISPIQLLDNGGSNNVIDYTGVIVGQTGWQAPQLISTIPTGTQPLVVASTTMVTNLNAAALNGAGYSTGSFTPVANSIGNSGGAPTLTGTYVKIGVLVVITITITPTTSFTTTANTSYISGLPYIIQAGSASYSVAEPLTQAGTGMSGQIIPNSGTPIINIITSGTFSAPVSGTWSYIT